MDKWVLITGGTKGIGRAVANCLAKAGYQLILTYASDTVAAEATSVALRQAYGVNVELLRADITDPQAVEEIDTFLRGTQRRLDAVVLNAGITCRDPFEQIQPADWLRVFQANVHFPVFLLQRIVDLLNAKGSVVFTGSLMGIEPHSVSLAYGVTKSAVHALVKNLVKFMAPYGLRVNAVAPGLTETDFAEKMGAKAKESMEQSSLMHRLGNPSEIAKTVAFLASDDASFINGQVIRVDGGVK